MIYKNEDALAKDYKENIRHGAYFFYGSENYLIEKWTGRVLKEAGEQSAFNSHRFDGKRLDLDAFHEAVEALPLMASQKTVLVDDLDWGKLAAAGQKRLAEILMDLPEDCLLVVNAKAPGFDEKSAGAKKLVGLFDKAGCAVNLGARSQSGQVTFLKGLAKKHGCSLSGDVARYILRICDTDMLALESEMVKICAYAGAGEIDNAHVDAVAIPKTEARVFDLRGAILEGNTTKAMGILDGLFYLRESPVGILAVLIRGYVELYRAKIARDNGVPPEEMTASFGYKGREFIVRNAFTAAGKVSTGYLRRALDVLYQCDRALKSTGTDDRVLLEQAVVQLFTLDPGQA